jgi:MFS family permease
VRSSDGIERERTSNVGRLVAVLAFSSALVTLDGTAVTLAVPAIGRALSLPLAEWHWISDAVLLMLAVLLLPAGLLGDRLGRWRLLRVGLVAFAGGALLGASSVSAAMVYGARAIQGAGAALILPSTLALIRASVSDPSRQARKFGVLAAWTGAAGVVGPLMGGLLVDVATWRAVFVVSAAAATIGWIAVRKAPEDPAVARSRAPFPMAVVTSRNCVAANIATFGLYFGVFALPFVLVVYTQHVLEYSALRASLAVLPLSLMMFLAAPLAKLSDRLGSRWLVGAGSLVAASGAVWIALSPETLPFWSRIVVGTSLFGLGVSMAAAPLTHAAVTAVGESCAGTASALNHAVVRAAGLVGIAFVGSMAASHPGDGVSIDAFRSAVSACGVIGASCGLGGALLLKDDQPGVL